MSWGCGRSPVCTSGMESVSAAAVLTGVSSGRQQVDEGEDHDPHDVDEVPVQADDLDGLRAVGADVALHRPDVERQQHDDADRYVSAVKAGEGVEARAEQVRGVAEAPAVEGRELIDLDADKGGAEQSRGHEPHP